MAEEWVEEVGLDGYGIKLRVVAAKGKTCSILLVHVVVFVGEVVKYRTSMQLIKISSVRAIWVNLDANIGRVHDRKIEKS